MTPYISLFFFFSPLCLPGPNSHYFFFRVPGFSSRTPFLWISPLWITAPIVSLVPFVQTQTTCSRFFPTTFTGSLFFPPVSTLFSVLQSKASAVRVHFSPNAPKRPSPFLFFLLPSQDLQARRLGVPQRRCPFHMHLLKSPVSP